MTTTKLSRLNFNFTTSQPLEAVLFPDGTNISNYITATKGIFGYGITGTLADTAVTNLVGSYGNMASDTTGVGTARRLLSAASYGGDKAIFLHGYTSTAVNISNLVSNIGVVSVDVSGVATAKYNGAAASYGNDKALLAFGIEAGVVTNTRVLISNIGVVNNTVSGVGTSRRLLSAAGYGGDKAIFAFGTTSPPSGGSVSISNLVSNTGVVASDTTNVAYDTRISSAGATYGGDRAVFYGSKFSVNLTTYVSNTGIFAGQPTSIGTVRDNLAGAGYGGDKAIFGFGFGTGSTILNVTNLVSSIGLFSQNNSGIGTARYGLAAASYS